MSLKDGVSVAVAVTKAANSTASNGRALACIASWIWFDCLLSVLLGIKGETAECGCFESLLGELHADSSCHEE
jgi:hypothetical protein